MIKMTSPSQEKHSQQALVEEIRIQWKQMWNEHFNDKVKAEGVSTNDYPTLLIGQGTIINATRDFKALNFKDILRQQKVENPDRYQPDKYIGGWNKFIKNSIAAKTGKAKNPSKATPSKPSSKQTKKSGRGWLNVKF
jgi:hypothetical protein